MPHIDPFDIRPVERSCVCGGGNGHGHSAECEAAFKAKLLGGKDALRAEYDRRSRAADN